MAAYGKLVWRPKEPDSTLGAVCVMTRDNYSDVPRGLASWWAVSEPCTLNAASEWFDLSGDAQCETRDFATWRVAGRDLPVVGPFPLAVEEYDVPCPKVRSSVSTRWYRGRWEKETKRGWVMA